MAVWEMGFANTATESRDDRHALGVTLTRRTTFSPDDRQAEEVIHRAVIGLEVLADQVISAIHADFGDTAGPTDGVNNYAILNAANAYIQEVLPRGATAYGFCEPLRFQSASRTEEKGGDWFSADPSEKAVGRVITLQFGEAKRLSSVFFQA